MSPGSVASSTSSIPDEEEPRLKYQRLEADIGDLLLETEAACLCVSEKMLALGTRDGGVHLLDYDGNEVISNISIEILNCAVETLQNNLATPVQLKLLIFSTSECNSGPAL